MSSSWPRHSASLSMLTGVLNPLLVSSFWIASYLCAHIYPATSKSYTGFFRGNSHWRFAAVLHEINSPLLVTDLQPQQWKVNVKASTFHCMCVWVCMCSALKRILWFWHDCHSLSLSSYPSIVSALIHFFNCLLFHLSLHLDSKKNTK